MSNPSPTLSPEDAKSANRVNAGVALEHIEALRGSEHFKWFVEHILEPARQAEEDRALKADLPNLVADYARQRHDALRTVCRELERLRQAHRQTLGMPKD